MVITRGAGNNYYLNEVATVNNYANELVITHSWNSGVIPALIFSAALL